MANDKDIYTVVVTDKTTRAVYHVDIGDEVTNFRGDTGKLTYYNARKVFVDFGGGSREFFPGVINAEIMKRSN